MENCFLVKVCVLGQASVGKTSLALRFAQNTFQSEVCSTVGASFLSRNIKMKDGSVYKLQIWDTAGQEKYRSLTPLYYRGAAIILIVYDITNEHSITTGVREWVHELRVKGPEDAVIVLVGNKLDKEDVLREVETNVAKEYADKIGALFFEASAKTGENVMNVFLEACSSLDKDKFISCYHSSNGVSNHNSNGIKPSRHSNSIHNNNNDTDSFDRLKTNDTNHSDAIGNKRCCAT